MIVALVCAMTVSACVSARPATIVQAARPEAAQDASDANSLKAQAVERLALQIIETPTHKAAVAKALKDFQVNPYAGKPDFLRHVRSAADEAGAFAALYAAMGGVPEPAFLWIAATPRRWHGYSFPGSRWFGDNADTLYRAAKVDDQSTYEITVRPGEALPAQLSFLTYNWSMLETGGGAQDDVPLSAIEIRPSTPRNADGSITLIAGPGPADGRPNFLELKRGVKQIHVREIRGDWSAPSAGLSIKRTSGPTPASRSLDELSKEAAVYLDAGVAATNDVTRVFGELAENQLAPVRVRWAEGA